MAKKKWVECQVQGCYKGGTLQRYKQNVYEIFPNGYCPMHNARYKRHGSPHGWHKKWKRRPAIIEGEIAKIPLGINAKDGYAIIDANMAHIAEDDLWNLDSSGYACVGRRVGTRMHTVVMGKTKKGYIIDHINRNKLDNRMINLRFCSYTENNVNKTLKAKYAHKYKGVYKQAAGKTFYVKYKTDSGIKYKGLFKTEEDAALFYNKKQREYYGEYITLSEVCNGSKSI